MALAVVLAAPSHAGLIKCQSHSITAMDLGKATSAARRTAGHSRITNVGRSFCMNPGRGRVWFEAVQEPQPDGSVISPHVMCTREMGPWTCEKTEDRAAKITVEREGTRFELEFDLPLELSLDEARQLVAKAYEIGSSISNAGCREQPDPKDPQFLNKRAFAPNAFDPAAEAYEREVVIQEDGGRAVVVDSDLIKFARSADGGWEVTGCGIWITVA